MVRNLLKILTLSLGILIGIFCSTKLNALSSVHVDSTIYKLSNDIILSDSNVQESKSLNDKDLVVVNSIYKDFVIDLKYATEDNFTKTKLYDGNICYLQKNTLKKLISANDELMNMGYRIKIWDAYRPLSVQKKMWAILPNSNYIANPFKNGSNHNRGAAVDITLVDINGNELTMPTGFDGFGSKAHRDYNNSSQIANNVKLLTDVMIKHGFSTIDTEWWHFDDLEYSKYPVMNFSFDNLMRK